MKRKNFSLGILVLGLVITKVNAQDLFDPSSENPILKHQVLLTNLASFKDHNKELSGASAFLINYRNKIFAVTAKHVLGEHMGVVPEIKLKDFNDYLVSWKMFPRVPISPKVDTVEIGKMQLNYDSLTKDILLLEVANTGFNTFPLNPTFTLPTKGEKLYIIGCPYDQPKCKQNTYEVFYDSYDDETSMLIFHIKSKFEVAGFSGAPIVNANGNVVSILNVGLSDGTNHYIGGTSIRELEKVQ